MKIFAFYLPQFHEIPENNKWWGDGFTEWVNVKKATPLFNGHKQPKLPKDNNYYDLMDPETVKWQTNIMHEYKIDGMIYYHYYFKGKMLLEKPAENLLKMKEVNQPFFFCWANHNWNRAWEGKREILVKQEYGTKADWKKHFDYLLPFFLDDRYEKIHGKPVFMIYDSSCSQKEEMFKYFDKWCKEEGLFGIHIIEERFTFDTNSNPKNDSHIFYSEPSAGRIKEYEKQDFFNRYYRAVINRLKNKGIIKKVQVLSGDRILERAIKEQKVDKGIIPGLFFEWDNTPRHGYRGYIISPVSKNVFMKYMNKVKDSDYIFVNAWNEWAEGMMLEPTEEYGYKYLSWIKEWKENIKNV